MLPVNAVNIQYIIQGAFHMSGQSILLASALACRGGPQIILVVWAPGVVPSIILKLLLAHLKILKDLEVSVFIRITFPQATPGCALLDRTLCRRFRL